MDPGYKAVGGLIDKKNQSAFDGKAFGREDDDELVHERHALAMVGDPNWNQGSEFFFFLGEGSTVCAAQMDTKHQVIGSLVGGALVIRKIEQLMYDNFNSDKNLSCTGATMRPLGGRPASLKSKKLAKGDEEVVVISACGQCEWSRKDAKAEKKAVARAERVKSGNVPGSNKGSAQLGPRDAAFKSVAPNRNRGRVGPRDGKRHQSAMG